MKQMKTNNGYIPHPVDTSEIHLTQDMEELVEEIAHNVHEVWAQSRLAQGWVYGPARSDELKTHPCLVPYEDLPEVEKQYDRDTAVGTLKLMMKLGFKISK